MPDNVSVGAICRKEVEVAKDGNDEAAVIDAALDLICAEILAEKVISIQETIIHGIQSNGTSGKHMITVKLIVYYRS